MKPIDIVAGMLVHALQESSNDESLPVVFLIMSKVIGELPGDNSVMVAWMDHAILRLSHLNSVVIK